MLPGAKKDEQIITSSWHKLQDLIAGVKLHEVAHVPGNRGVLTEIFRPEWDDDTRVGQIFQVQLFPGALSAWHCHQRASDRLFMVSGHTRTVLFDARPESPTHGRINEFHLSEARPALLVIPPLVWHGVQNIGNVPVFMLNVPTAAYNYEDPDHYRLPPDSEEIPFSWQTTR